MTATNFFVTDRDPNNYKSGPVSLTAQNSLLGCDVMQYNRWFTSISEEHTEPSTRLHISYPSTALS